MTVPKGKRGRYTQPKKKIEVPPHLRRRMRRVAAGLVAYCAANGPVVFAVEGRRLRFHLDHRGQLQANDVGPDRGPRHPDQVDPETIEAAIPAEDEDE